MVTLLTPLPVEAELDDDDDDESVLWELVEPVEPVEPELVVVAVGLEATVVPVEAVDVWLASAGSRPSSAPMCPPGASEPNTPPLATH